MPTHKRLVMFVAIGVCLGLVIWFALLRPVTSASQEKTPKHPALTALPKIKSCVEHVKLVKAEFEYQGDSQVVALELENQAYIGVISISVEQIFDKGKDAVISSAFRPDQPPLIVIEPGERKTLRLGNLQPKSLIRIGGVMFSDGTEEGCESSLKQMRKYKDHDTKKGGTQE